MTWNSLQTRFFALAVFAVVLASMDGTAFAQSGVQGTPTTTLLISNGPSSNRIDIVFVAEGYVASELVANGTFSSHVTTLMSSFFANEPFNEYQSYFNVRLVNTASVDSGIDFPYGLPNDPTPIVVDTAFNASNGTSSLLTAMRGNAVAAAQALLPADQRDLIVILCNTTQASGRASASGNILMTANGVTGTFPNQANTLLHEMGHLLAGLGDEYVNNRDCEDGSYRDNISTLVPRSEIKWNDWIALGTTIPTTTTTPATPGLYQGAMGCAISLYRPTFSSKMNANTGNPFEQVNTDSLVRHMYDKVDPIISSSPAGSTLSLVVGQSQSFSVTHLAPRTHSLTCLWYVDGVLVQSGGAIYYGINSYPVGTHTVAAIVTDPTPWVRVDPSLLTQTRTWTVTINPPFPKLLAISPTSGSRGSSFTMTLTGTGLLNGVVSFTPGSGITVSNTSTSYNEITCTVTITPGASLGTRTVKVTTIGGTSLGKTFTVN